MRGTRVVSSGRATSQFVVAAIAASLMSVIPASAEEPISLRELASLHVSVADISGKLDKQIPVTGGVSIRVDQRAGYWFEQMYILPGAENQGRNIVVLRAGGHQVFNVCSWSGTSF